VQRTTIDLIRSDFTKDFTTCSISIFQNNLVQYQRRVSLCTEEKSPTAIGTSVGASVGESVTAADASEGEMVGAAVGAVLGHVPHVTIQTEYTNVPSGTPSNVLLMSKSQPIAATAASHVYPT
jgi:hypothetical protein